MVFRKPHVIVVGSGLAGLSSAIEAIKFGAKVTLIEKEKFIGGNSAKATSGINGVGTKYQKEVSIKDSIDIFESDVYRTGGDLNDCSLVRVLSALSSEAISWLSEDFELDLSNLSQCGGHSVKRTHREPNRADGKPSPIGWDIVSKLKSRLLSINDPEILEVMTESRLVDLIIKNSASYEATVIEGVKYSQGGGDIRELLGDAVILATGGFGHDFEDGNSLLKEFAPNLSHLATTNGPWATGDAVKIGRNHGIATLDLDKVQVHPTSFIDPKDPGNKVKFLAPESLRAHGAILLNSTGQRFVNELAPRDHVTGEIFKHCTSSSNHNNISFAHMILNEKAINDFGKPAADFYASKGLLTELQGVAKLADHYGIDTKVLEQTFSLYNQAADGKINDVHGKTVFPTKFVDGKFYCAKITPSIHYTMGGLKMNAAAEIQKKDSEGLFKSILGLFGAGEVTGGVHGKNRLAGNSLLECVVFGRIAGKRAAEILVPVSESLKKDSFTPLAFRERINIGNETKIFRFNLPSGKSKTGMSCGQYVSVEAIIEGEPVIRYYSPISRPDDYGVIDLLIKVDSKGGKMSHHLNALKPGDTLGFKGPMGGPELDYFDPSSEQHKQALGGGKNVTKIGLICGGTGIAPMIQIIRSVLHYKRHDLQVKLMYGATNENELAFRDLLERKSVQYPNIKLHFYLENLPVDSASKYNQGFIDKAAIAKHMFPPANDVQVILCGPPAMCKALKPVMADLGFNSDNFFSYM